ncbi:TusE/DsrC/DsvC family sulfur relay protein [Chloroflexota bacterium]
MTIQRKTPANEKEMDEDGFLLQPETWTKKVAQSLTRGEILKTLTPDHWKVIDCVRQYYLESGTIPPVRLIVRSTGFSLACIHELFPNGYLKGICRVAGIPRNTVRTAPVLPVYHNQRNY